MNQIHSYISILSLSFLLASCADKASEEVIEDNIAEVQNEISLNKEQFIQAGIVLSNPLKRQLSEEVKASGQLGLPPANQQRISIPLGGWIVSCDLLPGSHVNKGEVLLKVKSPQYLQIQQEYLEVLAKLPYLKSERDRQASLLSKEVASKREFEKAEADFQGTMAMKSGLESKLRFIGIDPTNLANTKLVNELISIRSNIHGYVGDIHARVGDYMTENESVMEIMDLSHLHVELKIFEKDIQKIKVGQKLQVRINHATEAVQAEVYLIGKSLSNDKTVDVHCHLHKEESYYLPGMYVEAKIALNENAVWCLPNEALHLKNGAYQAFVLLDSAENNYRFKMIPVKTIMNDGHYTSIEGDSLQSYVNKGSFALLSGLHNTEEEEE